MTDEQSIRDKFVDVIDDELQKWGEGSPSPYAVADSILASPVIRRIQAEVWTEGFRAGRNADHNSDWWPRNPYRKDAS